MSVFIYHNLIGHYIGVYTIDNGQEERFALVKLKSPTDIRYVYATEHESYADMFRVDLFYIRS